MAEIVVHSPLEVCQLALDALGSTDEVSNIDAPQSREEKLCARHYPHERRRLFEAADWSFASKEALLSEVSGWTSEVWTHAYGLPDDFIYAREIVNGVPAVVVGINRLAVPEIPSVAFDFAQFGGVRVLVADVEQPVLRYTADVEVRQWPAAFTEAMVWRLASRLAGPLKVNAQLAAYAQQMAERATHAAVASVGNEVQRYSPPDSVLNRRY